MDEYDDGCGTGLRHQDVSVAHLYCQWGAKVPIHLYAIQLIHGESILPSQDLTGEQSN